MPAVVASGNGPNSMYKGAHLFIHAFPTPASHAQTCFFISVVCTHFLYPVSYVHKRFLSQCLIFPHPLFQSGFIFHDCLLDYHLCVSHSLFRNALTSLSTYDRTQPAFTTWKHTRCTRAIQRGTEFGVVCCM